MIWTDATASSNGAMGVPELEQRGAQHQVFPIFLAHGYKIPGWVRMSDTKYPYVKKVGEQKVVFLEVKTNKND
ncbi:MAG: hypothetical protein WAL98_12430 [Desulfatiglandaceae bacterium]|jgi:hypothetical protein